MIKRLTLILILICSMASAQTIRYGNEDIKMSDKYSGKGYPYHRLSFKHETDMKDINIYGSVFYQECLEGEEVVKDIFPDDATITFYNCNLDNILIPSGCQVIGGSNKKLKIQNDWEDWILDNDLKPIKPMNKELRLEKGISVLPKDIPKKKLTKEERNAFEDSLNNIISP